MRFAILTSVFFLTGLGCNSVSDSRESSGLVSQVETDSGPVCLQNLPLVTDPTCTQGFVIKTDHVSNTDYCCEGAIVLPGSEHNEGSSSSSVQHDLCLSVEACPPEYTLSQDLPGPDCRLYRDHCGVAGYDTDPDTGECICECEETETPATVSSTTGELECATNMLLQPGDICTSCQNICRSATYKAGDLSQILFVIDKSGSMVLDFFTGESRWTAATQAVTEILNTGAPVEYGLQIFPTNQSACDADQISIPIGSRPTSDIASLMTMSTPFGKTPLATAMDTAYDNGFTNAPTDGSKAVILVSDGENFGCGGTNDEIFSLVTSANKSAGIQTFAISLTDNPLLADFLDNLAVLGGTHQMYAPKTQEELVASLWQSLTQTMCSFPLPPLFSATPEIHVFVDGTIIPPHHWELTEGFVTIQNDWCRQIVDNKIQSVTISADCPAPPPT